MEKVIVAETPTELRTLARAVLKGNWRKIFAGMLIYSIFAALVPNLLSSVVKSFSYPVFIEEMNMTYNFPAFLHLYQFVMLGILEFGLYAFILHYLRTREVRYERLFAGFERLLPVFLLSILTSIFVGLWSLLFVIPGIIALFRYYMAMYILHDNPAIGPLGAIKASKWMTYGNKSKIFLTLLSFIGWRLLAMTPVLIFDAMIAGGAFAGLSQASLVIIDYILSIPGFFLLVYSETTMALLYEIMSGKLRKTPPVDMNFMPQGGGSAI